MAVVQLTLTDVEGGEVRAELRTLDGEQDRCQTGAQMIMESVMAHMSRIAHEEEQEPQTMH